MRKLSILLGCLSMAFVIGCSSNHPNAEGAQAKNEPGATSSGLTSASGPSMPSDGPPNAESRLGSLAN